MTSYYRELYSIVSFETDPHVDVNADARVWTPSTDWMDRPGGAIGAVVLCGGDYTPIPASEVAATQQWIRERFQKAQQRRQDQRARKAEHGLV